jgi:hypothetical protein
MNPGDKWYFAYGRNLDVHQKTLRTRRIRQALRCRLPGYRFAFNKRGEEGQPLGSKAREHLACAFRLSTEPAGLCRGC